MGDLHTVDLIGFSGMLTAITEITEIRAAYNILRERIRTGDKNLRRSIGWRGGSGKYTVHWHEKHKFWAILRTDLDNRYVIEFGIQNPVVTKSMELTCEINPPKSGVNRSCAGVFLKAASGEIFLGHSGRVAGGRKGISKESFLRAYPGKTQTVDWTDGRTSDVIVLGKITAPQFLSNVARFIVEVDNFKRNVILERNVDALVKVEATAADVEGVFDPNNLTDARERTVASIVRRQGQPAFRKKLLRAYGGCCAISDCDCDYALEAAHIQPYLGSETDHITNGLLLRSDLHLLFDYYKISVGEDFKVLISEDLKGTVYEKLERKPLRLPADRACWPNLVALKEHRAKMQATWND